MEPSPTLSNLSRCGDWHLHKEPRPPHQVSGAGDPTTHGPEADSSQSGSLHYAVLNKGLDLAGETNNSILLSFLSHITQKPASGVVLLPPCMNMPARVVFPQCLETS